MTLGFRLGSLNVCFVFKHGANLLGIMMIVSIRLAAEQCRFLEAHKEARIKGKRNIQSSL